MYYNSQHNKRKSFKGKIRKDWYCSWFTNIPKIFYFTAEFSWVGRGRECKKFQQSGTITENHVIKIRWTTDYEVPSPSGWIFNISLPYEARGRERLGLKDRRGLLWDCASQKWHGKFNKMVTDSYLSNDNDIRRFANMEGGLSWSPSLRQRIIVN